jgi:lipoate-protein ligase A
MKWINQTESNAKVAIEKDEQLLYHCENQNTGPLLRTWQLNHPAIIMGKGNNSVTEVHQENCKKNPIPIIKRCSGGGTVIIGPGCLCYSLILPISFHPQLKTINGTNTWIMTKMAKGLSSHCNIKASVNGYTDLCIGTQKFSGNAQRRLKKSLLFHGTLLFDFDLSLITKYLAYPSQSPAYRNQRSHTRFITQLPIKDKEVLIQTLNKIWI